jgi:hypothetical protein
MLHAGAPIGRDTCFRCADLSCVGHALETAGRSGAGGSACGGARRRESGANSWGNCAGTRRAHANSDSYSGAKTNGHCTAAAGRMDVECKTPVYSGSAGIRSNATCAKIPGSFGSKLLDRCSGRTALRPVAEPLKRVTYSGQLGTTRSIPRAVVRADLRSER